MPPIAMCPGTSPRMACLGLSRTDSLLTDRLCAIRRVLHEHLARAPPAFSPSAPSLPQSLSRWPCPPVSCVLVPPRTLAGSLPRLLLPSPLPNLHPNHSLTNHLGSGAPYPWLTVLPRLLTPREWGPQHQLPRPRVCWSSLVPSFQPHVHIAGADPRSLRGLRWPQNLFPTPRLGFWLPLAPPLLSLPTPARSRNRESLPLQPSHPSSAPASSRRHGLILASTLQPGPALARCILTFVKVGGTAASGSALKHSSAAVWQVRLL